ncbi:hypothetical protein RND81_13G018500 [Saponaria officinalis]|uniref:Allyl alcohol dehydrogenase-like protein n=1 Tax=Saponaria officinalis TaxID=3572 RepID=A0AAW1H1J5_SAPOF
MGLLWWKKNNNKNSDESKPPQQKNNNPSTTTTTTTTTTTSGGGEVAGMNGAEVVNRPRPTEVTVFEFGSVGASADKVTLAGYCPVSEELEPCRWEILTGQESDAPQFRVVF